MIEGTAVTTTDQHISRQDIENKFVELQTNLDAAANSAADVGKKVGIVILVLVLILAFLLGRRRGAANKTVVEIRRI